MARTLEMLVRRANGCAYVEATERDDPDGRRAIDRAAWRVLARPDVVSVDVHSHVRSGGYRRR